MANDQYAQLRSLIEELRMEMHDKLWDKPEEEEASPEEKALGMVAMVHGMQAVFEPLRLSIERDASKDAEVGQRLEQLSGQLSELNDHMAASRQLHERLIQVLESHSRSLDEHATTLRTPKVRTGRVQTPEGPIEMTITESRGARKEH